jgi:hypothetical protein
MAEINTSNLLYEALMAKYKAQRLEALHGLSVYFTSSAGIGEHSDLITEASKFAEMLANADDVIQCLQRNFQVEGTQPINEAGQ